MAATFDVESVERFVEKKDVGFLGECPGDVGALLLAAGKLVDLAIGNVAKIHGGNGILGFIPVDFPEAFEVSEVGETPHRDDVSNPDGEMTLMLVDLRKVSDFASSFGNRILTPVDDTGLLLEKTGQESNEGAFSCAVWSQKGEALTAVGREFDLAEGFLHSVAIAYSCQVELMVLVAHGYSSQVKVSSSVAFPRPQRV